jgi:hypothetical protein
MTKAIKQCARGLIRASQTPNDSQHRPAGPHGCVCAQRALRLAAVARLGGVMGGVNGGKLMGGLQADVELHGSGDGCFYRSFTLRPHCGHRPGVVALSLQVAPAMKPGIKDAYLPLPPSLRGPRKGTSASPRPIRDTFHSSPWSTRVWAYPNCDSGLVIFGQSTAVECASLVPRPKASSILPASQLGFRRNRSGNDKTVSSPQVTYICHLDQFFLLRNL